MRAAFFLMIKKAGDALVGFPKAQGKKGGLMKQEGSEPRIPELFSRIGQ